MIQGRRLLFSQVLTRSFTPVVYICLEKAQWLFRRKRRP